MQFNLQPLKAVHRYSGFQSVIYSTDQAFGRLAAMAYAALHCRRKLCDGRRCYVTDSTGACMKWCTQLIAHHLWDMFDETVIHIFCNPATSYIWQQPWAIWSIPYGLSCSVRSIIFQFCKALTPRFELNLLPNLGLGTGDICGVWFSWQHSIMKNRRSTIVQWWIVCCVWCIKHFNDAWQQSHVWLR